MARKRKNKKADRSDSLRVPTGQRPGDAEKPSEADMGVPLPPVAGGRVPKQTKPWAVRNGTTIIFESDDENEARRVYIDQTMTESGAPGLWFNNAPYETSTFIP